MAGVNNEEERREVKAGWYAAAVSFGGQLEEKTTPSLKKCTRRRRIKGFGVHEMNGDVIYVLKGMASYLKKSSLLDVSPLQRLMLFHGMRALLKFFWVFRLLGVFSAP